MFEYALLLLLILLQFVFVVGALAVGGWAVWRYLGRRATHPPAAG